MWQDRETLQRVLSSFREVNRVMVQILREEAESLDLTAIQIMVLRMLHTKPDVGLAELAESLQLGNSTMSGVVDRLVSAELVVRERSTADRRTLTMRLTPDGEAKQEEAFGEDSWMSKRLYSLLEISEKDLEHLFKTHNQILEKLQREPPLNGDKDFTLSEK